MQRCPICRGRINDNAECQRCGADLSLAQQAREQAESLTRQALKLIAWGEFTQAESLLTKAQLLEYSPFNQHVLGFVRQCVREGSCST